MLDREELVERVVEAMANADLWPGAWDGSGKWVLAMSDPARNAWRNHARAALAVIEPVVREAERKRNDGKTPC